MKKIFLFSILTAVSGFLQADITVKTETVKGTPPQVSEGVVLDNSTMPMWPVRVGDVINPTNFVATDPDGDQVTKHAQWLADGVIIPGATALTYTAVVGDVGRNISMRYYATTPAETTDPFESETHTSVEVGPVQSTTDNYPPDPLYVLDLAKTTKDVAEAACIANGDRLPTQFELIRTYIQSTRATAPGTNNTDMCTVWGWGLSALCGGATDYYWAKNSSAQYVGLSMRIGQNQTGGTYATACVSLPK